MFGIILYDIANLISFGPFCAGTGLVFLLIWYWILCKRHKAFQQIKAIGIFSLGTYLSLVLEVAILSRESGSHAQQIDWSILHITSQWAQMRAYVIENIIMFIPLGILLPVLFRFFRKSYKTIFVSALFSSIIEFIQYYTGRGYCQLEDVVTNTIGAAIGFIVYIAGLKIYQHIK